MTLPIDQIIVGDCLEVMKDWPDGCIPLTVTSPPYDDLRDYKGYKFDFEGIAKELYRITKDGGVLVWVVDDKKTNGSESGTSLKQALYFMSIGFNLHDKMIYEAKNGSMGAYNEYLQCWEFMFVFAKGKIETVNLLRDRKNVVHGDKSTPKRGRDKDGTLAERHIVDRDIYGRRKNIWRYPVGGKQELGNHPAIFPEQLAADHIVSWSNEGDIVFDPMCGSGTTPKQARRLSRIPIGIDISEEYCEIARQRLEAVDTGVPVKEQRKGQQALFPKDNQL